MLQCEYQTTRKDKLREHQFSKHQGKYQCLKCWKFFSRTDRLDRHLQQRHPQLNPIPMDWIENVEREFPSMPPAPEPVVLPSPTPPPPPASVQEKYAFNKRFLQKKWLLRRKDILKVFREEESSMQFYGNKND